MTDHLADARACIQAAAQAPHPDTRISWLTATCEQIIAHLEAQQTPQEATTAPPAAQQGEPGHGDRNEGERAEVYAEWAATDDVVLALALAGEQQASIFDTARAAIAAAEPHIRAKIAAEIEAARRGRCRSWDYGEGLLNAARIARQEQP